MKKFLAFLLTIIVLGGVVFFSIGPNFFAFNLILQNKEHADADVEQTIASYGYATYYDIDVVYDDGTDTYEISLKIDFVNEEYIGTYSDGENEYEVYYTEDKFYFYNKTENIKNFNFESDFDDALEYLLPDHDMFLMQNFSFESSVAVGELKTTFAYSFVPFYIGLTYTYTNVDDSYAFTYDAARTLRIFEYNSDTVTFKINMNNYGKVFELSFPSFDDYTESV